MSRPDEAEGGTGGTSSGGAGTGGATGGTGAGGYGGRAGAAGTGAGGATGGTGGGTCLAFPSCPEGRVAVTSPEQCVPAGPCEPVSLCGATIWCTSPALCDAIPFCDPGDTQLSGPCPSDVSCYTRSLCGTTIWCLDACNPDDEPNREYLLTECAPGDVWSCAPPTTSFVGECGCGCEQDSSCPAIFSCRRRPGVEEAARAPDLPSPGGAGGAAPPPYCDDAELARCPYSEVAY